MKIVVILDNIRSVHNVGSVFRTSDAFGVDHLVLCGTTPQPVDRFGRVRRGVAKVALGAEQSVSSVYFERTQDAINDLKQKGFSIVSVEQSDQSQNYKDINLKGDTAFIFGNEVDGVTEDVLEQSDTVIEIPMRGIKESLNVSVAAGIILSYFLG